jgi:hypothetical protein
VAADLDPEKAALNMAREHFTIGGRQVRSRTTPEGAESLRRL